MGAASAGLSLGVAAVDGFFRALGAIFFLPVVPVGLVIFILVLLGSRYLALLAVFGYVSGWLMMDHLLFEPDPGLVASKDLLLIRLDNGLYLLLAHLQSGSIKVSEQDRVSPGQVVAACGNSGRSPQPHLHMQVQRTAELGSPTYGFHLCSIMLKKADGDISYEVVSLPHKNDKVMPAAADDVLASLLHMPVGHRLVYELESATGEKPRRRTLTVELTLLGQFRLVSESGASAAFEEANGVLAFYDRKGPADPLLDMWVLANGLTPLTELAHLWHDAPSVGLLPLTTVERVIKAVLCPLGCGLETEYRREWDGEKHHWVQSGRHRLKLGTLERTATTQTIIDPGLGCTEITMQYGDCSWRARLVQTGLIADVGIPEQQQTAAEMKNDAYMAS